MNAPLCAVSGGQYTSSSSEIVKDTLVSPHMAHGRPMIVNLRARRKQFEGHLPHSRLCSNSLNMILVCQSDNSVKCPRICISYKNQVTEYIRLGAGLSLVREESREVMFYNLSATFGIFD